MCPDTYFECDSGQCLTTSTLCNGHADCIDGSDEIFATCTYYYGFTAFQKVKITFFGKTKK